MPGADRLMDAPPVVMPVGLTEPMVSASLLDRLTAPVASEAKMLTSLRGTPVLAALRV